MRTAWRKKKMSTETASNNKLFSPAGCRYIHTHNRNIVNGCQKYPTDTQHQKACVRMSVSVSASAFAFAFFELYATMLLSKKAWFDNMVVFVSHLLSNIVFYACECVCVRLYVSRNGTKWAHNREKQIRNSKRSKEVKDDEKKHWVKDRIVSLSWVFEF